VGDIVLIGDRRPKEEPEKKEALRLPFIFGGRKGNLVIEQGLPWLPVQHYTAEGIKTYAQLGPGEIEWEDAADGTE